MKRAISILMAIIIALGLCACSNGGGTSSGGNSGNAGNSGNVPTQTGTSGLQYEPKIGGYVVTGYSGIAADIVIPDNYADGPVIAVSNYAFRSLDITGVTLGANVKEIDKQTFSFCNKLTSVRLNEGLEKLDGFSDSHALKEIVIPASVIEIDSTAFHRCYGLEKVTFAKGSQLDYIDGGAFKECGRLTEINLQDTAITKLDSTVFKDCKGIKDLYLPASLTAFGTEVFSGWTSDQTIHFGCREEDIKLCYSGYVYSRDDYTAEQWDNLYNAIFSGCQANLIFQ